MAKVMAALKNYFVPHAGNDHMPHILRRRAIVFALAVMMVAEMGFLLAAVYVVPRIKLFGLIEATALINETNSQRTAHGEAALAVSPLLTQAAQDKANDMVANGYFAHTSPSGVTPWSWFEKVGYSFSFAGENLAINFQNSQDVTDAWMNSPEHRANILNGEFTQIGMAAAQGTYEGKPTIFVVELFGTPASAPVAFVPPAEAASVEPSLPAVKPSVSKPSTPTAKPSAPAPVVVVSTSAGNSGSQQLFVAVKGAETQAVAAAADTTTANAAPAAAAAIQPAAQAPSSIGAGFQWLVSNPRAVADDFYIVLIILFGLASLLNIFVKIKIQFPRLIASGLGVIVIAGLCVMLNQGIGLGGAAIL